MEGSRHEKAALISVAYLLGAVTIFIGYQTTIKPTGISNTGYVSVPTLSASVITATKQVPVTPQTQAVSTGDAASNVSYANGVLAIQTEFGNVILSYNPAVSGLEASDEFKNQGIHTGPLVFRVAPGDTNVFFCEQKNDTDACSAFIYNSLTDRVYPVQVDSVATPFTRAEIERSAWLGQNFSLPGYTVVSPDKPWLLLTSGV